MKFVLISAPIVIALVAAVLTIVIGGMLLPIAHRATASVRLSKPPEAVWPLVSDPEKSKAFRPEVKGIQHLPLENGRERYRELGAAMGHPLTLEVMENTPPRTRVTRIDDDALPFGGTWTYELTPDAGGTRLRITEDGEVRSPAFRYIGRVMGQDTTIRAYLKGLAEHLGEAATIEP